MSLAAARFGALFLMLLMVLPAAGPLVDHHFAERQVDHVDLSMVPDHSHSEQHFHVRSADGASALTLDGSYGRIAAEA